MKRRRHSPGAPYQPCNPGWDELPLGELPDLELAARIGVHPDTVAAARRWRGLAEKKHAPDRSGEANGDVPAKVLTSHDEPPGHSPPQSKRQAPKRKGPRVISMHRMTKEQLRVGALLYPERGHWRPTNRQQCRQGPRPCPYVSCRYHLALDVTPVGNVLDNFPGKEISQIPETCALDVADRDGATLEQIGTCLNLTRERVRQLVQEALRKVGPELEALGWGEISG